MSIPFETLLALLILEMHRQSPLDNPASLPVLLAAFAVLFSISYLSAWIVSVAALRRLRFDAPPVDVRRRHRRGMFAQKMLVVLLFSAFVSETNWPYTLDQRLGILNRLVVDEILLLLPFVLALVLSWVPAYRVDCRLAGRTWTLGEFLGHQLRNSLFIVIPWFLWGAASDLGSFLPTAWQAALVDNVWLSLAATIALVISFPVVLKVILGCRSMPAGPMRERLDAFCQRHRLSCRDILVWHTGGARILNAGVMGLVPRFRYVMFTDALLEFLSPTELEAVLGHELGHVRHWHMHKYFVFLMTFVVAASSLVGALPAAWQDNIWILLPVVVALGFLILYVIFGFLSRRFERQADLESARLMGTPVPLVTALERMSLLSGTPRTTFDWRHDSVANRVDIVLADGFEPQRIAAYARRMRRLTLITLLAGFLAAAGALWLEARINARSPASPNPPAVQSATGARAALAAAKASVTV